MVKRIDRGIASGLNHINCITIQRTSNMTAASPTTNKYVQMSDGIRGLVVFFGSFSMVALNRAVFQSSIGR